LQRVTLRSTLEHLGLKQNELARLIAVSPRLVSDWAAGEAPIPGPVVAYLRLLERGGKAALAAERTLIDQRSLMLDEGLYDIAIKAVEPGQADRSRATAMLRGGTILGSDPGGAVFSGSYRFDAAAATNRVHLKLSVPPYGELVNGYTAGADGAMLEIVGEFARACPVCTVVVEAGGRPIEVELTHLGPLPC